MASGNKILIKWSDESRCEVGILVLTVLHEFSFILLALHLLFAFLQVLSEALGSHVIGSDVSRILPQGFAV